MLKTQRTVKMFANNTHFFALEHLKLLRYAHFGAFSQHTRCTIVPLCVYRHIARCQNTRIYLCKNTPNKKKCYPCCNIGRPNSPFELLARRFANEKHPIAAKKLMPNPKKRSDLKVLLLQIRDNKQVREEELVSFGRYSGLAASQFDTLNVFDTPSFPITAADKYDALFVGGASEASVLEPEIYTFVPPSIQLLQHCIERGTPVFASCYGFQLAVLALGGCIIRDNADYEMGTIPINLSAAATHDPVFSGTPSPFMAVSVHRERATSAPAHCTELAFTEKCCHAFKVNDKPFWAFQFHPEVDKQILVERLTVFKDKYTDGDDHLSAVLEAAVETPHSNQLLASFVDRILLA